MSTLETIVSKLRPLLEEYSAYLSEVEDRIRQQGIISQEICVKCSRRNIEKVLKFGDDAAKALASFLNWIKENDIRELTSNGEVLAFKSTKKEVESAEGSIPLLGIGQVLGATTEKVLYDYRISVSKLQNKPFAKFLSHPFSSLQICPHVSDVHSEKYLALVTTVTEQSFDVHRVENLWQNLDVTDTYKFLCRECFDRIDSIGCEGSIRKEAFAYVHTCPTRRIVFQNLLEKHGIKHVLGEQKYHGNVELMFFLPELEVLVSDSFRDLGPTVGSLKPDSLLVFGRKQELSRFLQFGTNVIIFDPTAEKDNIQVFDKNIPVESSEERIIDKILSDLDQYSSEVRGKEHDKLVEAFRRIGEELGFIAQAEMLQTGARVDIVWLGRDGKVEVAIEVETSAQWKKDIVTTWETSPKLAIVLAHYKTDKGTEDITQYNLLQYMPHKLLFISYLQKKAYLIEKGSIIKSYDIKSAK